MPTGSGKTWVYSLIAKHYSEEGKGTTIIVPNETLREQTIGLIGTTDDRLIVLTIAQYYENPTKDGVVIVDEYDEVVESNPFFSLGSSITGLWTLDNRELFFFTATSSRMLERIIGKIIGSYHHLQLKSEFEFTQGCSSLGQGLIKPMSSWDEVKTQIKADIEKALIEQPIIVICKKEKKSELEELLSQFNQI